MDSVTGRFISEDPGNDPNSSNLYSYCLNNPINRIDPSGMFWEELGNWLGGYGWQSGLTSDDKAKINEQRRIDTINNTYSAADAQKIFDYEANNPGFKFNPYMDRAKPGTGIGFTLNPENQLQLYLFREELERQYSKNGTQPLTRKAQQEIAKLTASFASTLYVMDLTHPFNDRRFYSMDEINDTVTNIQAFAFATMQPEFSLGVEAFATALETNAMLLGAATEAEARVLAISAKMAQLPGFTGGKTAGILEFGETETLLTSGWDGAASGLKGIPGMDIVTKSHVEAHAVAVMRQQGITEATLYINNPPCSYLVNGTARGCENVLTKMLPTGSKLTVVGPNGYYRVFIGQ